METFLCWLLSRVSLLLSFFLFCQESPGKASGLGGLRLGRGLWVGFTLKPALLQHNSGFYGHYRGQFRSDSARAYRFAAKPQPPAVFLQRCQEAPQQHFFSKHDNRTSFDKGIGRRKDLERLWQQHTFLRWASCELDLRQPRPLESSYQTEFRSGPGLTDLPQRLVHFVQIQPLHVNTTYQQNFCHPSQGGHCGSDNVGPQTPVTNTLPNLPGIPRPKLLQHYLHAGVSECLNWSRTLNKDG